MRALYKVFALRGLGLERLLDALQKAQLPLYHIKRSKAREIEICCPIEAVKPLKALVEKMGYELQELPPKGLLRWLLALRQSICLPIALLLMALLLSLALRFVWHIDIRGAGMYSGEVRAYLAQENIRPGMLRSEVDIKKLCDELLYRLPRVAWVRARFSGLSLQINITQGTASPLSNDDNKTGNVVAVCDGIIDQITVYAGTAAVQPGKLVHAGDVLIYGSERGSNETKTPVHARGCVQARVWYSAQAMLPLTEQCSVATGNEAAYRALRIGKYALAIDPLPNFLTYDEESTTLPLVGAWFPIVLQRSQCSEVYFQETAREMGDAQSEAGRLAMQNLLLSLNENDEIIDKWLDYSMIKGETILATATAEILREIGRFEKD